MRTLFIYNSNNAKEREIIERAKNELGPDIEEVDFVDFNTVRDHFKIRTTPALIFIRDDLQGEKLMETYQQNNKLRALGEIAKALQEEELNLHQTETNRIDSIIKKEVDNVALQLLEAVGV